MVGIGLKELHLGSTETDQNARNILVAKEESIREWLDEVTGELIRMNEKHYPLGKLQHLVAAHKGIVNILSKLFPSSSSADEILPMLIYSLVTSQCENLNVISNLNFIQRFRANDKLNGEAAYCLVNLEAAVSFLETVDLSSLRADEAHKPPQKETNVSSKPQPKIPQNNTQPNPEPEYGDSARENPESNFASKALGKDPSLARTSSDRTSQGRFSVILQNQTHRLEAVRGEIIGSADQAFDNISSTLDNSFNFLFGRLREQAKRSDSDNGDNLLPKTLEDARKLVGTPPPLEDDNDSVGSVNLFTQTSHQGKDKRREDQRQGVSEVPVQHKLRTESSQDSIRTAGSRRSIYSGADPILPSQPGKPQRSTFQAQAPTSVPNQASSSNAAVESMKNLSNTLNPLKGFSNMNIMPRFGRGTASPTSSESPPRGLEDVKDGRRIASLQSMRIADELRRVASPSKKFLDVKDASELRIKDVEELLKDYRRLADGINKVTNV